MLQDDTIVAISTAPGRSGIGIVRMSGPDSLKIAGRIFRPLRGRALVETESHRSRLGWVFDPATDGAVDQALFVCMRAPNSYTSEDVVEISCHGGPVPLANTLKLALRAGARLAEPGEFTKRAFLAGRIDLAQAEAVCDLIQARTGASGRLAALQLQGRLSTEVRALRAHMLSALAEIEAGIDFPEEDVEEITRERLGKVLGEADRSLRSLLQSAESGRVFREGIRVAIVGRPNAGKSSLLNALLGHDRAIVTDVPGTTRDAIEETANIKGVPFVLIDTAGIRETADFVERIGVARAEEARKLADLTILVIDTQETLDAQDVRIIEDRQGGKLIIALNKRDLGVPEALLDEVSAVAKDERVMLISTLTAEGLPELEDALYESVVHGDVEAADTAIVTNVRHQACLIEAAERLEDAMDALERGIPYDLLSIDLRAALDATGRIIGDAVGEDLLDEIFSKFCIGK